MHTLYELSSVYVSLNLAQSFSSWYEYKKSRSLFETVLTYEWSSGRMGGREYLVTEETVNKIYQLSRKSRKELFRLERYIINEDYSSYTTKPGLCRTSTTIDSPARSERASKAIGAYLLVKARSRGVVSLEAKLRDHILEDGTILAAIDAKIADFLADRPLNPSVDIVRDISLSIVTLDNSLNHLRKLAEEDEQTLSAARATIYNPTERHKNIFTDTE